MFGVSTLRRWVPVILLGLLAVTLVGLTGCGGKKEVDPYVYDSLRRVICGDTLSTNFLFEIDAPEFDYVQGNVAIIRGRGNDKNLLEFLVGDDLENRYRSLDAATLLGVQKTFTPQPTHLVLRRIKQNGVVVADSLPTPKDYVLPALLRSGAIDNEMPGAPLPEIGWNRKDIDEAKRHLPARERGRSRQDDQERLRELRLRAADRPARQRQGEPGPRGLRLVRGGRRVLPAAWSDLTPGAEWMLELLKAKDLPLIGAFTVLSLTKTTPRARWSTRSGPRGGHDAGELVPVRQHLRRRAARNE